jgi:tetratricopeptide (TPR) repeat protein
MENEDMREEQQDLAPEIKFTDVDQMSLETLLKVAEENYDLGNFDKCKILYDETLRKYAQDEKALCACAYFLNNINQKDRAKKLLLDAVVLNPEGNHKKYLYLAELFQAEESATLYLKAIQILTNEIPQLQQQTTPNLFAKPTDKDKELTDATKDLSQAFSALGELYMTDLSSIPNAVNICKEYLLKSIEVDENNLDGYLQLGNYFLEVDDPETAAVYLDKLVLKYKLLSDTENFDNEYSNETLLHMVRTMIDVQAYANALVILEDLILDDDKNAEVLYLLSYCNFFLKNYLTCEEYLEDLNKKEVVMDKEILAAKSELEQELTKVDFTKGNDYEEIREGEEHISNHSMELE